MSNTATPQLIHSTGFNCTQIKVQESGRRPFSDGEASRTVGRFPDEMYQQERRVARQRLLLAVLMLLLFVALPLGQASAIELRTRQFALNSRTGGIQEAINALPPNGGVVIVDQTATLVSPVALNKSGVEIRGEGNVALSGAAFSFQANNISLRNLTLNDGPSTVISSRGGQSALEIDHLRIARSAYSGMFLINVTDTYIHDCVVTDYNSQNTNGHAGIAVVGSSSRIKVERNQTSSGNGNGIRIEAFRGGIPSEVWISHNRVERTTGYSAEGMTASGNNVYILENRVDRTFVTGILVYAGVGSLSNIVIQGNIISDSSQDSSQGSHPAISLAPQSNSINGVVISNNIAFDDQSIPTQGLLLTFQDNGLGGTVQNVSGSGNIQINQLHSGLLATTSTVKKVNIAIQ